MVLMKCEPQISSAWNFDSLSIEDGMLKTARNGEDTFVPMVDIEKIQYVKMPTTLVVCTEPDIFQEAKA